MGISFGALRFANIARLPRFKNAKGEAAHEDALGRDWTPADWMTALVGEVGEAANLMKKIRRGDVSLEDPNVKQALADEFADIATYLDILAMQMHIDLGEATRDKFNRISDRVGANVKINIEGKVLIDSFVSYHGVP